MYAWKCWRDTRARYLTLLITCLLLAVAVAYTLMFSYDSAKHRFVYDPPRSGPAITAVWTEAPQLVLAGASLAGILLGLTLGGGGLGEELQNGTAAFLLARPRRRIHFVRVRWAVAIAQLAGFSMAVSLALFCTLFYCTHHVGSLSFLWMGLVLFTYSMLMFALADLITLLRENVRDGVALAVGFAIACFLAAPAINNFFFGMMPVAMRWDFRLRSPLWRLLRVPSPADLLRLPSHGDSLWRYFSIGSSPYVWTTPWILQVAGWLAAACLFLIPAERVFERKEI